MGKSVKFLGVGWRITFVDPSNKNHHCVIFLGENQRTVWMIRRSCEKQHDWRVWFAFISLGDIAEETIDFVFFWSGITNFNQPLWSLRSTSQRVDNEIAFVERFPFLLI